MLDEVQIIRTTAVPAAVTKRETIRKEEIRTFMGPAMQAVLALVQAGAVTPAGKIFSHHYTTDPEHWDFEVGIPVRGAVSPSGRVVAGELPARTVARTVYHGGYEGLGAAWGEFHRRVAALGKATTGEFWEVYTKGPESGPDPKGWATELNLVLG